MRVSKLGSGHLARATPLARRAAILFVVSSVLILLLYGVLIPRGHLVYAWPVTGVQLALLLAGNRSYRDRGFEILAAAGGNCIVSAAFGLPLLHALALSSCTALELWVSLRLLRGVVGCFDDLKRRANVFLFLGAALCAPLCSSLCAPLLLPGAARWRAVLFIALSDSLGIAVFAPTLLLVLSGRRLPLSARRLKAAALVLAIFAAATTAIFSQNTYPFLFLTFPPLIAVVFTLGSEGAAIAALFATVLGSAATALGHGPVWINPGLSMDHRILALQFFLWTTVATALPIGSLLDERRTAEQRACASQAIYQTLLANSDDMIVLSRLDGSFRFVSPAVARLTGWSPEEYLALRSVGGIHPEDRELARDVLGALARGEAEHTFRYRTLHKEGGFRWVEALVRGYADYEDSPLTGYVATVRDISALKQTEDSWSAEKHALAMENEHLATLAGRDELTGLANRRTFNQALSLEAARQSRSTDPLSLLMIDVDFFKRYNDRYGHQAGDVCLQALARALVQGAARTKDLAARLGGEEFAILLPQTDEAGALQVASLLLEAVQELAIPHEDSPVARVTISIGVATWLPHQENNVDAFVDQADQALYSSKHSGRNRVSVIERAGPVKHALSL